LLASKLHQDVIAKSFRFARKESPQLVRCRKNIRKGQKRQNIVATCVNEPSRMEFLHDERHSLQGEICERLADSSVQ
jgi:hypothetical protein